MNETKLMSALTTNGEEPRNEDQRRNNDAYRAPRLVVIGTAVELVQGGSGNRVDGPFGCVRYPG